jgi:hypothetical protein
MHEQKPRNLPWLDRLTAVIPGYGGYQTRANRRAADRALRDAIATRLTGFKTKVEQAVQDCIRHGALTEIAALERVLNRLDRIIGRVRSAGSGTDEFYSASDLESAKADPLHAADVALFDRAVELQQHFELPDFHHDRLPRIDSELDELERKLDERALLLQGIR